MSRFKKIMDRLFGADEDKVEINHEQPNHEQYNYENDETTATIEKSYREQGPSFRFPIISDAEIYGWDDAPIEEQEESTSHSYVKDADDDYEPIPLYENERWKKKPKVGNVYRFESTQKYETESKFKKSDIPPVESTVQKRSSRPFIPTEVPSPIFGYANPKNDVAKTLVKDKVELTALDELEIINGQSIMMDELMEQDDNLITEDVQPLNVPPLEQIPVDMVDSSGIEIEDVEHPIKELPKVDAASLPELIEVEEESRPEIRKEKIRPFNVLMLKSDKEKINALKPSISLQDVIKKHPEPALEPENIILPIQHREQLIATEKEIDKNMEEEPYYAFPLLDYLIPPEKQIEDTQWLEWQSEKLEEALSYFAVQATVIEAVQGPTVTRFEITVGHGTKVSKIRNLTDDLKLALAAEDIRIQAPIPGKSSIGIEIPNRKTRPVRISEVIQSEKFLGSSSPMEAVLGLDLTGLPVTLDLRKMPHGMIAGATGSGKSVCINSILVSLLYKASPADLKMMLIDPKMVELAPFNGIPHLISPVITDVKAATAALKWAVSEMERRYELLAHAGVRDIERYNKAVIESRRFSLKMPYLLIVIDELADLMMMAPADVEVSISRIAQKARACGIHLIIATQRPSVDVITGTIKANIPTRIAFSVSSQIDSRTIIDSPGAERLLGKGDMLYIGNGQSSGVRLQGTFVTDNEIERIIEHVQNEAEPNYLFGQDELLANSVEEEETDPLFEQVCHFIFEQGSASTSLLQRNFSIGYNRAAKLIDRMEKNGFVSGQRGSKARDVFLTESDLNRHTDSIE
ncbi:DNA translocase FtsK [Sporosarcina limicola]|uniref:S-DNA-T family DNA segregation ATPase FtsK/SpoIIIE n=1 Tax=Sporosarcina limicola TaxID=34101 RepID=A0A927R414_9BACL|nr:DNA translocase FtsK [Sporosarcina limicola]MBE1554358.1 S-DNA-T family DNA segregation ATPase FtsK/SpoIIIE [Sporosarcina limicola]